MALRRRDAAWLREVLGGRYSYDELMALVADLRAELAQAETASALPVALEQGRQSQLEDIQRADPKTKAWWERYLKYVIPFRLMQAEPRLLLHDFVSDPHNYVGILRAIANNARTQKKIAAFTGLAQGHISQ